MTLTMAYESTTRRTGRVGRPFTPEEDDTLRRLAAEGHTRRQIATAMGRQYHSVRHRGDLLGIAFLAYAPGRGEPSPLPHCRRCTILLSAVPPPQETEEDDTPQGSEEDDGLCRWCRVDR